MKEYSLDIHDLPGEVWKDIEGFEGKYQVSNKGRVKSLDRYTYKKGCSKPNFYPSQIMKLNLNSGRRDYLQNCRVNLSLGEKHKKLLVNRVVAKAFIPNPNNLEIVLHKDGDISNNCVENLKWVDVQKHRDHERITLGRTLGKAKKKVMCVETGVIYDDLQKAACAMGCKLSEKTKSNHVGLTYALQQLTCTGGKYKPNPEQIWKGYHWKTI